MTNGLSRSPLALAVATVLGAATMIGGAAGTASTANANERFGQYVAGDFHNHTTCSDGSISMQKKVDKSLNTPWGLDWFVQAGHGGNGNRNCTLAEDETLATPAYPLVFGTDGTTIQGPGTTWLNTNVTPPITIKGAVSGSGANRNMWRWQSVQEFQYPLLEYLARLQDVPMFTGVETVAPGHEHTSMSVITGQMPATIHKGALPRSPGYLPLGTATALAQWEYCFDRNDTDTSRGNTVVGGTEGNNWDCSVTGSANALDPSWNATGLKLDHTRVGGVVTAAGTGDRGHAKTLEALKWMKEFHPNGSYYVPAHLERAGPFNPNGNNGFNIEHLRNFNNTAPSIAFGFESQPGHHASDNRGEYLPRRNNIGGVLVDSVGGTTWGGTGVYASQIGGVWDALLGEGRNWWFFGSSDWHNRGIFNADDRRSTQDFYPGEYQRNYTMVRGGDYNPQAIVDGLRSGNTWVSDGQIVDRFAIIACAVPPEVARRTGPLLEAIANVLVETVTTLAAWGNTDEGGSDCATMGEKLVVRPGSDIIVSVVVRDPSGTSYSPYTFGNPSLAQVGIKQPLNKPVLDHIDVIRGLVTGYKNPADGASYAGQWPNTWLANPDMATVPAAAKNTSAELLKTFNARTWSTSSSAREFKRMTFRLRNVQASQYVRVRGTNLPPSVPFETDANGNPLADLYTNSGDTTQLRIPCKTVGTTVPDTATVYTGNAIDGCPSHLPVVNGQKMSAVDVAAWADLWVYGNPVYVEVKGSTPIAGVK